MNISLKMFINRTILGFCALAALFSADAAQKTPTHISAVIMIKPQKKLAEKLGGVSNRWIRHYSAQADLGGKLVKINPKYYHSTFVTFEFPADEIEDKVKFQAEVQNKLSEISQKYLSRKISLPFEGYDILHGEKRIVGSGPRDYFAAEFGKDAIQDIRDQIINEFKTYYPEAITRKDFRAHVTLDRVDWDKKSKSLMLPPRLAQVVSDKHDADVLRQVTDKDVFEILPGNVSVSVQERTGSVMGGAKSAAPKVEEARAEKTEGPSIAEKSAHMEVSAPGGPMSAPAAATPVAAEVSSAPAVSKGAVKAGCWTQEHEEAFEKMFNNKFDDALSYIKERGININTNMARSHPPVSLWSIIKYKLGRMNSSQQKAFQEIFDEQAKGAAKISAPTASSSAKAAPAASTKTPALPPLPPLPKPKSVSSSASLPLPPLPAAAAIKGAVKAAEWTDMHTEVAQLIRNWQKTGSFENFAQAADYIQQGLIPDLTAKEPDTRQTLAEIAGEIYANAVARDRASALDSSTRWQGLMKALGQ